MAETAQVTDLPAPSAPGVKSAQPGRQAVSNAAGILPYQDIMYMTHSGEIAASRPLDKDQIQPASIDLRLGTHAYRVDTSFLPGREMTVLEKLEALDPQFDHYKIDLRAGAVLEKNCVYVVPLLEALALRNDIAAFANPKSSTGRLDILTRLIADGAAKFDEVESGYKGQLYIEIAPRSFSIVAKSGARLNQLRFCRSRGENRAPVSTAEWQKLLQEGQIVHTNDDRSKNDLYDKRGMLPFTVDLKGSGKDGALIGWRAKKHTGRIDLERRDYDAREFWEPLRFHKCGSIILSPDEFYILMTKEAIAVPPDYAAEMLPYDTRAGEFRVHYAGFFDPGFGWNPKTRKAGGSRGVLEVRSHEVPFLLEHGQTVGWLRYERMAAPPDILYGQDMKSNYQGQGLKLAKQFAAFEDKE